MGINLKDSAKKIKKLIDAASTISIVGHVHPDGDCVGSCLAVYNYITENYADKTVDVYLEALPAPFKFLSGSKKVKHELGKGRYDLSFSLDCSDTERHGKFAKSFSHAITTVTIDHHVTNKGFGDICVVDGASSSTCEVIAEMLDMDKVSLATAECLYLGMVHDTGVFKYSCTGRRTMEIAGLLLEKGVRSDKIIDDTFYKKTYKQNLLMARTLLESRLFLKGKVILGVVTREMFRDARAVPQDTEGIVEQLRLTDGVEAAVFVYQLPKKQLKFSLRSKEYVDVSKIAEEFGGGGHIRAAGFETSLKYEEALNKVLERIEEQLKQ